VTGVQTCALPIYKLHILEHRVALLLDIVADDVALRVEGDTGNFLAASDPRPDPGKEEQVADSFGVRKSANRFGGT